MTEKSRMQHPPEVIYRPKTGEIYQKRQYKLLTPLYGGGVSPRQNDPLTLIRGTGVRGHLRFWWRATQSGRFQILDELRRAESAVWGSTETPSEIKINIIEAKRESSLAAFEVKKSRSSKKVIEATPEVAPYAAFPLLPDKKDAHKVGWRSEEVSLNITFTLEVRFPERFHSEVEDAFWAWETFGGIGARTRRGFGAISRIGTGSDESGQIIAWLKDDLKTHVEEVSQPLVGVPYLSRLPKFYAFREGNADPIKCWKDIILSLKNFRQARYKNGHGLSKWPEANTIRRLHGEEPKSPDEARVPELINKFPRAKLGLPINFHMPHDREVSENLILQGRFEDGKWFDRMASPLLLRPITWGGKTYGLAAVLQWQEDQNDETETYTPPGGLKLKGAPGDPKVYSDLTSEEASSISFFEGADILSTFLAYFES